MGNPQALAEQAAQYRALAARGDLPALSRAVLRAACNNGSMTGVGLENMELQRALPDKDRLELAGIWARWYAHMEDNWSAEEFRRDPEYLRTELLMVASGVVCGLDGDLLAAERQKRLFQLSNQYLIWSSHRVWELADAELTAGRTPDPAVLAAFRRTNAAANLPGFRRTRAAANGAEPGMRNLLAKFPGPVLNPGEAWTDQALREVTAGGEHWQRLLAHACSRDCHRTVGEVETDWIGPAERRWPGDSTASRAEVRAPAFARLVRFDHVIP